MEINTLGQKSYGKWATHTPYRDPLRVELVDNDSKDFINSGERKIICTIEHSPYEEDFADLIAAAPVMLEVCREIVSSTKKNAPVFYEEIEEAALKGSAEHSDEPIYWAIEILNKLGEEIR
tara:strand:- start:1785 stop:2147 length:363 start_codon:yes stop_codon:yes gene_type:complete